MVLAFPVAEDGTADALAERPVYAFLPIRPYGFRFAIQADVILASGREDIHADRPWNQWLRDLVPPLFLQAVESFKADAGLRTTFLAYVPSPDQVMDAFFHEVPDAIVGLLQESEYILTASGRWVKPAEALRASDAVRQLLTNEEIDRHLQKELVHESFKADAVLMQVLG